MVLTITRDKVKCESLVLAIECIKLIPRVYRDNCKNRSFTPIYAHVCPRPTYFCRSGAGVIGVGPPPATPISPIIDGDSQNPARRAHLSSRLILCTCPVVHLSDYRRVQLSDPSTPLIIGHSLYLNNTFIIP